MELYFYIRDEAWILFPYIYIYVIEVLILKPMNEFKIMYYIIQLILFALTVIKSVEGSAGAQQASILGGLSYQETENIADWPGIEEDWYTAIKVQSNKICNLMQYHMQATNGISPIVMNANNLADCQRECEKDKNILLCEYTSSDVCNGYSDAYAKITSSSPTSSYAGICMEHHDFAYDSSYWYKTLGITSRAKNLIELSDAAPTKSRKVIVSERDRHVICFGANPIGQTAQDRLLIRFSSRSLMQKKIANVLNGLKISSKIKLTVDVDPINFS